MTLLETQSDQVKHGKAISGNYFDQLQGYLTMAENDPKLLSALEWGGVVGEFETRFSLYCESNYALSTSSGTSAIQLALAACNIGPGDEVIVSPYGWGQTVAAILALGAVPVFADIDPISYNLDPQKVIEVATERTQAVLVTHLFGHPADMPALRLICDTLNMMLIADAAQALGASTAEGLCTMADVTAFSFGRGKALCTGEGGMTVTDNPDLHERMVALGQHPLRARAEIEDSFIRDSADEISLSLRMHPFAAVLGLSGLKSLDQKIKDRCGAFDFLRQQLQDCPGIKPPSIISGLIHGAHRFVMRFQSSEWVGVTREDIVRDLQTLGVPIFAGPVRSPIYKRASFQNQSRAWFPRWFAPGLESRHHQYLCCEEAERMCREEVYIDAGMELQDLGLDRLAEMADIINTLAGRKITQVKAYL